jgi:hypothetical protein
MNRQEQVTMLSLLSTDSLSSALQFMAVQSLPFVEFWNVVCRPW